MQINAEEFKQYFPTIYQDNDCINELLSVTRPRNLAQGEQLIRQNQLSDTVYLVMTGRLHQEMDSGNIIIKLSDCLPGCWVGELGFIKPDAATANITAAEETTVLPISQHNLATLLNSSPATISSLLHAFSLNLAERLRETRRQVLNNISGDEYALEDNLKVPDRDWFSKLANKMMSN